MRAEIEAQIRANAASAKLAAKADAEAVVAAGD